MCACCQIDRMWHGFFHLQPNLVAEDNISGPVSDGCVMGSRAWLVSQSSTPVLCYNSFLCAWRSGAGEAACPTFSQHCRRHDVSESVKAPQLSSGAEEISLQLYSLHFACLRNGFITAISYSMAFFFLPRFIIQSYLKRLVFLQKLLSIEKYTKGVFLTINLSWITRS